MSKVIILSLMFVFLSTPINCSSGDQKKRMELYFLNWNVLTSMRLTPYHLKKGAALAPDRYSIYIESHMENVETIENILQGNGFLKSMEDVKMDGRLLVEIYVNDVRLRTYFASKTDLCWIEEGVCRPIDSEFRGNIAALFINRKKK